MVGKDIEDQRSWELTSKWPASTVSPELLSLLESGLPIRTLVAAGALSLVTHGSSLWLVFYREKLRTESLLDRERRTMCCNKSLECGGWCNRWPGHAGPCLCDGDEDGTPGSCPA